MKYAVKSIDPADYAEFAREYTQMQWLAHEFKQYVPTGRIDTPETLSHKHKYWEWCRALQLINKAAEYAFPSSFEILDIGAAYSLLGPALAYLRYKVTEAEPDGACGAARIPVNKFLENRGFPRVEWHQLGYGSLKHLNKQFNVVCSISTIEHVELSLEATAWDEMADMVLPGGLLIVSMDCMPEARKGYQFDDVRWTNYDMVMVKDRVDRLKARGFVPIGAEDYDWHGVHVHDYSFAMLAMRNGN